MNASGKTASCAPASPRRGRQIGELFERSGRVEQQRSGLHDAGDDRGVFGVHEVCPHRAKRGLGARSGLARTPCQFHHWPRKRPVC